eukprot:PITA_03213
MKIQKEEPKDLEEEECLFHSQMWVKDSPLQFIVNSGSQKKFISEEVVKWLGLPTIAHPESYTIGWLHQGQDLCLYRILEVASRTTISVVTTKQCNNIISKTGKFVFLMICPQGKKKMVAMTSRQSPSTWKLQMDKVMEQYEDIFTSLVGVPTHCQVKHSIDLTPGVFLPNGPIYRCSVLENDKIKRQIQELL